jgi:hypothetical protein
MGAPSRGACPAGSRPAPAPAGPRAPSGAATTARSRPARVRRRATPEREATPPRRIWVRPGAVARAVGRTPADQGRGRWLAAPGRRPGRTRRLRAAGRRPGLCGGHGRGRGLRPERTRRGQPPLRGRRVGRGRALRRSRPVRGCRRRGRRVRFQWQRARDVRVPERAMGLDPPLRRFSTSARTTRRRRALAACWATARNRACALPGSGAPGATATTRIWPARTAPARACPVA